VPKTILAVDDSATMRKVLEITFAGEDFRVVGAEGSHGALARMSELPAAAIIDTSLEGDDGYTLAKEIRSRDARVAIVLLASRYNPYDGGRGRDAGVDDYADKPFDTQSLIDKVKKAIASREMSKPAAAPAPIPVGAPLGAPVAAPPAAPVIATFGGTRPGPPGPPPSVQRPAFPTQRTNTLSFEGAPHVPPAGAGPAIARTAPSGTPIVQAPSSRTASVQGVPAPSAQIAPENNVRTAVPPRPPEAIAASFGNGQLAGKLDALGLTTEQVEAVLALSREVVERVVWEVVPQLAEVMIKEEIARLTKEG
jgi:CheY-like chemotaxis protein